MVERDIRQKIFQNLRRLGYWPITQTDASVCPRCGALVKPKIGRPDILVLHPTGLNIVVEVKTLSIKGSKRSFSFAEISEQQRKWLNLWTYIGGHGFIGLGIIRKAEEDQVNDSLLGIYLVPWINWLAAEQDLLEIQKSIPYEAHTARSKRIREESLDITTLFSDYRLVHDEGESFDLPPGHLAEPRLF